MRIQPQASVPGSSNTGSGHSGSGGSGQSGSTGRVGTGSGTGSGTGGSGTHSGQLPETGQSSNGPLSALGGALVLFGAALLAVGYIGRRRPTGAEPEAES